MGVMLKCIKNGNNYSEIRTSFVSSQSKIKKVVLSADFKEPEYNYPVYPACVFHYPTDWFLGNGLFNQQNYTLLDHNHYSIVLGFAFHRLDE
jgi:hypothetical protein